MYPAASLENPLANHKVTLTIKSKYYRGWGSYFESRTRGVVQYNHDANQVTLVLKSPIGRTRVTTAVSATARSGDFAIRGTGSKTDSYNSSQGEYSVSQSHNGSIVVGGDFTIGGNADVFGNVTTGGDFICDYSANKIGVHGDVFWTDSVDTNCVAGDTEQISGIESGSDITSYVNGTIAELATNNDNAGTAAADGRLDSTATLGPGDYHVDTINLGSDETLTINTNGEVVRIAVAGSVHLQKRATIDIQGTGQVKLYVNSTAGHDFEMDKDSLVDTGTVQRASQFWVYGMDNMNAELSSSAGGGQKTVLEGVIYAPAGAGGTSNVLIGGAEVYGGVVAGQITIEQGGAVHFDEALQHTRAVPANTKVVKLTYLHVTHNTIKVS